MLATPLFNKFRVSEFIQFFTDVINLCLKNSVAATQVQKLIDALIASAQALENTFKISHASEITAQLSRLDTQRDQAIICLRKFADAYSSHYNSKLQAAGKLLLQCIDKYGSRIYSMNYQSETSTISNLGEELTTVDEMQAIVTVLKLDDLVAELIRLNNAFNAVYINRVSEDSADQSISSGEALKQTIADYRSLIEHLKAHAIISPSEDNSTLIAEINTLISQYNATVEQRDNHKDEKPDEPEQMA